MSFWEVKMKSILLNLIIINIFFSFPLYSLEQSNVLIISEPGCRVYIDDVFNGFTNEEQDGLYIEKVEVGKHIIEIKKHECLPQLQVIQVKPNQTTEVVFKKMVRNQSSSTISSSSQQENFSLKHDGYYYFKETNKRGAIIKKEYYTHWFIEFRANGTCLVYITEGSKSIVQIPDEMEILFASNPNSWELGKHSARESTYQVVMNEVNFSYGKHEISGIIHNRNTIELSLMGKQFTARFRKN